MEKLLAKISIDLQSPAVYEVIKAQQNDVDTRIVEVTITNNGDIYSLNGIDVIKFEGHRGDFSSFIEPCSFVSNIVTIKLNENLLAQSGLCEGRVVMYDTSNSEILSTPSIKISVQKDPCLDKENVSEDSINIVDQLILELENEIKDFTDHISDTDIHFTNEEKEEIHHELNDLQLKVENIETDVDKLKEDATPDNIVLYANDGEVVDIPEINNGGAPISITVDSELSETSKNPVQNKVVTQKLNEVFQSVSDGKSLIASAITDMGVKTDADATFEEMAQNIGKIAGGGATLNDVLILKLWSDGKLSIVSKIELSVDIDLTKIDSSVPCTSISYIDKNRFDLYGDFTNVTSIIINTLSGFFYDENISSTNNIDINSNPLEFITADEKICSIQGRDFFKTHDGLAIGGYIYSEWHSEEYHHGLNATAPILISETEEGCSYYYSQGISTAISSIVYDKDGKTYYISGNQFIQSGNITSSSGRGLKINEIQEIRDAVNNGREFIFAILDYYYGYI